MAGNSTTIDELKVLITANATDFQAQLQAVKKQLTSMDSAASAASAGITRSFTAMKVAAGIAIAGIGVAIGKNLNASVNRLDVLNNFPNVMSNLGIGAKDAEMSIKMLSDKLLGLPTNLDAAAMAVQRFTSANGNIAASTEMFLALNNAILAGGAPMQLQESALEQMSQAYAKGIPDAMEWRSMLSAMPAQLKQVAMAMGYSSTAIGGDMQTALVEGKISMNDFMRTIMELNQKGIPGFQSFAEQAKNSTGGVGTSIINLKTAFVRGMTDIMNQIGQSNIASFFNTLAKGIGVAANYVSAFVRIIKEAVAWLSVLFGGSSGSTSGLVKESKAAADGMGGIAQGAEDTENSLGGANKQAKQLAKQLAGFDQMNVMKTPDAGSGGGSGSGGGGGGGLGSDFDWDTSKLGDGVDKVGEIADRIKKILADMFDFEAIGKALKRFWSDVTAAVKPIGAILGDVWKNYLKPIISWTGNSLLPAVLNAIGGAIRFVGNVLGVVYFAFLKPFVDFFLVPIAKFTGGVIVGVLNGIGDALRFIAQSKGLTEFFSGLLVAILGYAALVKVTSIITAFGVALRAAVTLSPASVAAIQGLPVILGKVAVSMSGLSAAFLAAGGGFAGLQAAIIAGSTAIKTAVVGAFSAIMAHPLILAIVGIIAGITFVVGGLVSAFKQVDESTRRTEANTTALKDAQDALKGSTKALQTAEEELNGARASRADAEIAQVDAAKRQKEAQDAFNEAIKNTGLNYAELRTKVDQSAEGYMALTEQEKLVYDAGLALDSANGNLATSSDKVRQATDAERDAHRKKMDQLVENQSNALLEQAVQDTLAGKYGSVKEAVNDLKDKYSEYTDENGKKSKLNSDQVKQMSDKVGENLKDMEKKYKDHMSGADQGFFGPMGVSLRTAGTWFGDLAKEGGKKLGELGRDLKKWGETAWGDITKGFSGAFNDFKNIGKNIWDGMKSGIGNLADNMKNMFSGAVNNVKKFLGIASPSKLFKSFGKFVDQGFGLGITGNMHHVDSAMNKFKDAAFVDLQDFGDIDLSAKVKSAGLSDFITGEMNSDVVNAIEANSNQRLTVNIGADQLIDIVVNGINNQSFMNGHTVLDI